MFVVTNRRIRSGKSGVDRFGKEPNEKGPHELRIFEAKKKGSDWRIQVLRDQASRKQRQEVGLPLTGKVWASQYVAEVLLKRVREEGKHILFFIHGFNNDIEAVLERAQDLERHYDVEVVAFSWPANGGGAKGVASYKSDKRDARASVGAVYRFLEKAQGLLRVANTRELVKIHERAQAEHPNDPERQHAFITRASEMTCPIKVSLLLHSMGNYLFKQIQKSDVFDKHHMLFDNVVLAAADTNNEDHASWVDRIRCRKRVYVTINEDDGALLASRIKAGDNQKARLGHYLHGLHSSHAVYVDVTDGPKVGRDHAYFEGDPVKDKNGSLHKFFRSAFHGERAEQHLEYRPSSRTWRP